MELLDTKIQRNKKRWLGLLFGRPLLMLFSIMVVNTYEASIPQKFIAGNYWGVLLYILIAIPFFYHCSYKKKGTALLTFSIYSNAISLIILTCNLIISLIYSQPSMNYLHQGFFKWILLDVLLLKTFNILWIINSLQLRKLNFQIRFEAMRNSEKYKNLFESLENFTDLESLENFYSQSIREYPELEYFLSRIYKSRKKLISIPSR